jgi:hypothetical protein
MSYSMSKRAAVAAMIVSLALSLSSAAMAMRPAEPAGGYDAVAYPVAPAAPAASHIRPDDRAGKRGAGPSVRLSKHSSPDNRGGIRGAGGLA